MITLVDQDYTGLTAKLEQIIRALERQRGQTLAQIIAELDTACTTGTKKNAQGYKISWKGYKLHLDTACCGVPISAVLTGAKRKSLAAPPLSCRTAASHMRGVNLAASSETAKHWKTLALLPG